MPNLVILYGPLAVGKMTVGQELAKATGLKLFHNHMTIELVANFFSYGTPEGKRLVATFRKEIFEAVAASDLKGLIFTYVCAFDCPEDWAYLQQLKALFASHGGTVSFVELEADYATRFSRNSTENRLLHKPTKRDIEWSKENFVHTEEKYRLNSYEGEVTEENYLRLNNTSLSPEDAAARICARFPWLL